MEEDLKVVEFMKVITDKIKCERVNTEIKGNGVTLEIDGEHFYLKYKLNYNHIVKGKIKPEDLIISMQNAILKEFFEEV